MENIIHFILVGGDSDHSKDFIERMLNLNQPIWVVSGIAGFHEALQSLRDTDNIKATVWIHLDKSSTFTDNGGQIRAKGTGIADNLIHDFPGIKYSFLSRGTADEINRINDVEVYDPVNIDDWILNIKFYQTVSSILARMVGKPVKTVLNYEPDEFMLPESYAEYYAQKDSKYVAGDSLSAINKAKEVVKNIGELGIDLTDFGIISAGGGDGTELFYELEFFPNVKLGLLLEFDHPSFTKFYTNSHEFSKRLIFKQGRKLHIDAIEGDINQAGVMEKIDKILEEKSILKLKGLLISAHAILHELPDRSDVDVKVELVLKRFSELHKKIVMLIREPSCPEGWPEIIQVKVKPKLMKDFKTIAEETHRSFYNHYTKSQFQVFSDSIVAPPDLGIESVMKLFYRKSFNYEKMENYFSIDRKRIKSFLESQGFKTHMSKSFYTKSVQEKWIECEVEVREFGNGNNLLEIPNCFSYTIATKGI